MASISRGWLVIATVLASCTDATPHVKASTASLGQAIPRGVVAIEPNAPTPANSPQYRVAAAAVEKVLRRAGFQLAQADDANRSELIAVVDMSRVVLPTSPTQSAANTTSPRALETTTLRVDLRRRSDQTILWRGTASITSRPSMSGPSDDAASQLAEKALAPLSGVR